MMLLSIIIPAYNVSEYIDKCLTSILDCNIKDYDYEIVIVDDGSTDDTLSKIKEYKKNLDNLIIFTQKNKGQSAARNKGVELSSGEYIWFVDSDDYISSNSFDIIYGHIEKAKECQLIVFDGNSFNDGYSKNRSLPYIRPRFNCSIVTVNDFLSISIKEKKYFVQPSHYIIKAEIAKNVKFREGIIYEDNLYLLDILLKITKIYTINEVLYFRRIRENSTITSSLKQRNYESFKVIFTEMKNKRKFNVSKISENEYDFILVGIFNDMVYTSKLLGFNKYLYFISEYFKLLTSNVNKIITCRTLLLMLLPSRVLRAYKNAKK
ncbi:glycosyltransferase family 2 protein [Photobacterium leiognathi]|uniref:glycosyltransferase family 2 protein n=1 Tax=Photobacterium leiognathi TaxID=553611 RepID=UPI0029812D51|nr:glycosyltransferase [Photobacterium leiognathi]